MVVRDAAGTCEGGGQKVVEIPPLAF